MSPDTSALTLQNVRFTYSSGTEAVRDVSLTVGAGEMVALVGPSGCGKSTLLDIAAGLTEPSTGSVSVEGVAVKRRRGRFAYMPQRDGLLPWRSAADNAAFLVELNGGNKRTARSAAVDMLRRFHMEAFADSRPDRLSGGMRQRIALIRTVLPGASCLLDEPFGALDAITRAELQLWLLDLQAATGVSMLLVTHDVEEACLLADRIYVLSARPARVVAEVSVPFGQARNAELVSRPEFVGLRHEVNSHLRRASGWHADVA